VLRNDKRIRSYRDAQGFRKNDKKLQVALIDAWVHHYGWVRSPKIMAQKDAEFKRLWHDDAQMAEIPLRPELFDYRGIDSLARWTGTHPKVMEDRIRRIDWQLHFDPTKKLLSVKNRFRAWIERVTGRRLFEYRNYVIVERLSK
jgi:hypothetical protein